MGLVGGEVPGPTGDGVEAVLHQGGEICDVAEECLGGAGFLQLPVTQASEDNMVESLLQVGDSHF